MPGTKPPGHTQTKEPARLPHTDSHRLPTLPPPNHTETRWRAALIISGRRGVVGDVRTSGPTSRRRGRDCLGPTDWREPSKRDLRAVSNSKALCQGQAEDCIMHVTEREKAK